MTAPYQTDAPSSTITSPICVAVGAMNAVAWTRGVRPSNENRGTGPPRCRPLGRSAERVAVCAGAAADRDRNLGRVADRRARRGEALVEVLGELAVDRVAEHVPEL